MRAGASSLALALLLLVGGCGLQPVYTGGQKGEAAGMLGAVEVSPIADKAGFLVRDRLLLRLPPAEARALLERWRNPEDPLCHPQPPLNGDALRQALQLPAGPQLGALLQHLTLERAFGRLEGSGAAGRSQALAAARRWLERAG